LQRCIPRLIAGTALAQGLVAQTPAALKEVQHPTADLHILARIPVAGAPDWVAIDDHVWISNQPRNNLTEIDPATNRVIAVVPVGTGPCAGLAAGFGSIWVPMCGDGTVWRIDARSRVVRARIATGVANTEGGITVDGSSVWIPADTTGTLVRIDPRTNTIASRIRISPGSYTAVAGGGAIWITSTTHNLVTRVDPSTERVVATIPVGPAPRFLTWGAGALWVLNQGDGSVIRVAPETNQAVSTISVGVPGTGGDIAFGEGAVWVSASGIPLSRIDPVANRVVAQFRGAGGDAARVGHGSIWLSNHALKEVWRIEPPVTSSRSSGTSPRPASTGARGRA
jgi:virginiamycin B lyase